MAVGHYLRASKTGSFYIPSALFRRREYTPLRESAGSFWIASKTTRNLTIGVDTQRT